MECHEGSYPIYQRQFAVSNTSFKGLEIAMSKALATRTGTVSTIIQSGMFFTSGLTSFGTNGTTFVSQKQLYSHSLNAFWPKTLQITRFHLRVILIITQRRSTSSYRCRRESKCTSKPTNGNQHSTGFAAGATHAGPPRG